MLNDVKNDEGEPRQDVAAASMTNQDFACHILTLRSLIEECTTTTMTSLVDWEATKMVMHESRHNEMHGRPKSVRPLIRVANVACQWSLERQDENMISSVLAREAHLQVSRLNPVVAVLSLHQTRP